MTNVDQFSANMKRMKKLQGLLEAVDYLLLGETAESKTLHEELRDKIVAELQTLNETQKTLAKEIQKETDKNDN
jgi:ElaB/YqjD/DUF883 family membrane-anchored ribosome-binding protein